MKRTMHAAICLTAAILIVTLFTSCFPSGTNSEPGNSDTQSGILQQPTPVSSASPVPAFEIDNEAISEGKDGLEIASHPKLNQSPGSDTSSPYDSDRPKLMGFSLGTPMDEVVGLMGQPAGTSILDDEEEHITVFEYSGFSIGFTHANHIMFISVNSETLDPGLNGLKLGQTAADALTAIGIPDKKTKYVLNYYSNSVVLKLDIDPETKIINSIKLFSR